MLLRAYAFADKKAAVLLMLGIGFVGLVAIGIWVFCINIPVLPIEFYEQSGIRGCFPDYGSNVMGLRIGVRPYFQFILIHFYAHARKRRCSKFVVKVNFFRRNNTHELVSSLPS